MVNVDDYIRKAIASLEDNMAAQGRVPAPNAQVQFVYDDTDNTFRLSIASISRDQCPHTTQASTNINVDGVLTRANYCTNCKAIL